MRIAMLGPADADALRGSATALSERPYGPPVTDLTSALVNAGHKVVVITHKRGQSGIRWESSGLDFYQVSSRQSARAQGATLFAAEIAEMKEVLRSVSIDVVHAHWTYEWALAAIPMVAPTLVTIHDSPRRVAWLQKSVYSTLRLLMATRFRAQSSGVALAAASPYVASAWSRGMHDGRPIQVLPNIVFPLGRHERANVPTVVDVGSDDRLKNIWTLLEAFGCARRTVPGARLRLVGRGLSVDSSIARRAVRLGLDQNVDFLGPLPRSVVRKEIQSAWVHCHVSLEESFGLSVAEAMTDGTPVIGGTESGAVPWLLDGGRAGRLVDVFSAEQVATALVDLLTDSDARNAYSHVASERAAALSGSESVVHQTVSAYESLLA